MKQLAMTIFIFHRALARAEPQEFRLLVLVVPRLGLPAEAHQSHPRSMETWLPSTIIITRARHNSKPANSPLFSSMSLIISKILVDRLSFSKRRLSGPSRTAHWPKSNGLKSNGPNTDQLELRQLSPILWLPEIVVVMSSLVSIHTELEIMFLESIKK